VSHPPLAGRWSALLAVPDPDRAGALAVDLAADGVAVHAAATGDDALAALAGCRPDVAVVDLDLAPAGGLALLGRVRRAGPSDPWDPAMPVLAISGGREPHHAVRALEQGADDVMATPLFYPELLARLRAMIRRTRGSAPGALLHVGPLAIDRRARTATVHGRLLDLPPKELGLLTALACDPRRVVGKDDLLRDVWGYRSPGRTRTVDSHASRLRRRLAARCPEERFVCNVWGVGYRLLPDESA
jgi:DNA-binding response OmpR family regulator